MSGWEIYDLNNNNVTEETRESLLDELRQLSTPVIRVLCYGNNYSPSSELSNFYINHSSSGLTYWD